VKRITKKSYIKGVLRELDILGSSITYKSKNHTSTVIIQLLSDLAITEDEEFEILNIDQCDNEGELLFEIDYNVFKAKIKKGKVGFLVPDYIEMYDSRESKRLKREVFYDESIYVELRSMGNKIYGELVNVSEKSLLIITKDKTHIFANKENIEVKGYIKSGKVIEHIGRVRTSRETQETISYLLDLGEDDSPAKPRNQKRINLNEKLVFSALWPNDDSFKIQFEIQDLGYLGFKGKILNKKNVLPPLGSILRLESFNLNAHMKWREGNIFGCDLSCNDLSELGEWHEFIEDNTSGSFGNFTTGERNKKILNIFLRSGYLRKHKAYVFSKTPKIHEIIPSSPKYSAWIQRYGNSTTDEECIDTHISFLKLTNTSWLIQEASSMSLQNGIGKNLILKNLEKFYFRNADEFDLSSRIFALYDANMKFNNSFWDRLKSNSCVESYDTCVIELKDFSRFQKYNDTKLKDVTFGNWENDFNKLNTLFSDKLLSSFGIQSSTWKCEYLSNLLKGHNHILTRKVHLLELDQRLLGIAIQFGLPTIANVTSTANHLWLLVNDDEENWLDSVKSMLYNEKSGIRLAGVTEVVVIKKSISIDHFEPPFTRYFKLKLLSLIELKKILEVLNK